MNIKFLAFAVAAAFSVGTQAAPAALANGDLKAVIGDNGVFYPGENMGPTGGPVDSVGLSWKGVEFVNIDNRASWGVLSGAGLTDRVQSTWGSLGGMTITNDLGSETSGPLFGGTTTTVVSMKGSVVITETVRAVNSNTLSFSWTFTNTGRSAVENAMWSFGFDPDQGGPGLNSTVNTIVGTGNGASVSARDAYGINGYLVTLTNTTRAGAADVAAYVDSTHSCCGPVTAGEVFAGAQALGFSNMADDSINLGWKLGLLTAAGTPGDTATIGANLVFAVPEPETYAMFLAGLGLMGAVVRRRSRA